MEPNGIGPVDDRGDAFPERIVQPDAESTPGSNGDPITDNTSSEPDIIARNTSHVGSSPPPPVSTDPVLSLGRSTFST